MENNYSKEDKIKFIFNMVTELEYPSEIIEDYESHYKTDVLEELMDYSMQFDEDAQDVEEGYLMYYNANNLVHWYKMND